MIWKENNKVVRIQKTSFWEYKATFMINTEQVIRSLFYKTKKGAVRSANKFLIS